MTTREDKWAPEDLELDAQDEALLEGLFDAARAQAGEAEMTALMARIAADAEAEIDARAKPAARRPRRSVIEAMVSAVGGWRSVGGLGFATVVGVAIGLGLPAGVTSLATGESVSVGEAVTGTDVVYTLDDLVPSFYDLAMEG